MLVLHRIASVFVCLEQSFPQIKNNKPNVSTVCLFLVNFNGTLSQLFTDTPLKSPNNGTRREVQDLGGPMSRVFHRILVLGQQFSPCLLSTSRPPLKNSCKLKFSAAEFFLCHFEAFSLLNYFLNCHRSVLSEILTLFLFHGFVQSCCFDLFMS